MIAAGAALAMIAFAANSVLCRMALLEPSIDPASFTTIRLASGAAMLLLVTARLDGPSIPRPDSFASPALLALYAVPFSFAYTQLTTGTGALILFACVQLTMLAAAVRSGERIRAVQWAGLSIAVAGLTYLVLPTLTTPAVVPALLMGVAGMAWGMYSWRGRTAASAIAATTANFVCAVPLAVAVNVVWLPQLQITPRGIVLAVASGAAASGLGYVVWYAALRGLTGAQASVLQLSVPVIAAVGGVLVLGEMWSVRLVISAIFVLGGIGTVIAGREGRGSIRATTNREMRT